MTDNDRFSRPVGNSVSGIKSLREARIVFGNSSAEATFGIQSQSEKFALNIFNIMRHIIEGRVNYTVSFDGSQAVSPNDLYFDLNNPEHCRFLVEHFWDKEKIGDEPYRVHSDVPLFVRFTRPRFFEKQGENGPHIFIHKATKISAYNGVLLPRIETNDEVNIQATIDRGEIIAAVTSLYLATDNEGNVILTIPPLGAVDNIALKSYGSKMALPQYDL